MSPMGGHTKESDMPCCKKAGPILFKPKFSKAIWPLTLTNHFLWFCSKPRCPSLPWLWTVSWRHSHLSSFVPLLMGLPCWGRTPSSLSLPLLTPTVSVGFSVRVAFPGKSSCPWSDWNPLFGGSQGISCISLPGHEALNYNYMPVTVCLPLKFLEGRGHFLFLLFLRV